MISVDDAHLPVIAVTDPGRAGKNNEDSYAVSAFHVGHNDPTPSLFAIVADGVGGHQAGEVAAEMAVEIISQAVADSNADQPLAILEKAFAQANHAICSRSSSESDLSGMGTTASCVWIIADQLYLASIGDSRIYLKRNDRLIQLTIDHTWIQEAIESGLITTDQARTHPNVHLIRRHLGSKQPAIPDFRLYLAQDENDKQAVANQGLQLNAGDYLLLCSDGLTDLVKDDEIEQSLKNLPLDEALHGLVELSNSRGGHDNITIIGIKIPQAAVMAKKPRNRRRLIGILLLVIFIGAFLFIAWFFRGSLFGERNPTATFQITVPAEQILPTAAATVLPPTAIEQTQPSTDIASPSPISSPSPDLETPDQATYTPWPTSTIAP
jgi:protein phosphatase